MLDDLNPEQYTAASIIRGPVRTVAGPGTGKTKTKVSRIANMMANHGIAPESIVALTFTNAAADEMRQRIAKASGGNDGYRVFTGTYHSYFIQHILKPNQNHEYFHRTGYKDGFYVMTDTDTDRLLSASIKSGLTDVRVVLDALDIGKRKLKSWMGNHRSNGLVPGDVIAKLKKDTDTIERWKQLRKYISVATADGARVSELAGYIGDVKSKHPGVADIAMSIAWKQYMNECIANNGMDFDDVLVHAARLLRYDPEVGKRLANKHQYFSLDEYQDTNPVQFHVILGIVKHHADAPNVFTVGDARQSIYGFRNADVRLMVEMEKYLPGTQTISLVTNYRSSQELIEMSNSLAKDMNGQITDGQLRSFRGNMHERPVIAAFDDEYDEANYVCQSIANEIAAGANPEDIVVLYRARAARDIVEKTLLEQEIPYQIIGDTSFWERKEVQDCLALTRVLVREKDPVALYRVLDAGSFGVTPLTLRKNADKAGMQPRTYLRQMSLGNGMRAKQIKPLITRLEAFKEAEPLFDRAQMAKMGPEFYVRLMHNIQDKAEAEAAASRLDPAARMEAIKYGRELGENNANQVAQTIKTVYEDLLWPRLKASEEKRLAKAGLSASEIYERITERQDSINSFFEIFETIQATAPNLDAIIDDLTLRAESSKENKADQVKLMTNHASKGLEFNSVYMIGSEKEMYLRESDASNPERVNEEIRNFYTALTRGGKRVVVSYAENRMVNGETKVMTPFPAIANIAPACDMQNHQQESPADLHEANQRANESYVNELDTAHLQSSISM